MKEDNIMFMKRILIITTESREKPRTGNREKNKMNVLVPIPPISFPKSDPGIPHKVEGKV